jgi:hypothetical protein
MEGHGPRQVVVPERWRVANDLYCLAKRQSRGFAAECNIKCCCRHTLLLCITKGIMEIVYIYIRQLMTNKLSQVGSNALHFKEEK